MHRIKVMGVFLMVVGFTLTAYWVFTPLPNEEVFVIVMFAGILKGFGLAFLTTKNFEEK